MSAKPIGEQWQIIGRGKAGWHAKNATGTSSSGGDLNPYTYWTGQQCAGYAQEAAEGCLVYDAEAADYSAFASFIISGPIVEPSLPPEGVNRFTDRGTAANMMPGLDGAFATLATLAQSEAFSGLDYVGVEVYRALLAQIPGVKFGTVRNGSVVWEPIHYNRTANGLAACDGYLRAVETSEPCSTTLDAVTCADCLELVEEVK